MLQQGVRQLHILMPALALTVIAGAPDLVVPVSLLKNSILQVSLDISRQIPFIDTGNKFVHGVASFFTFAHVVVMIICFWYHLIMI